MTSSSSRSASRYRPEEVRALIEEYAAVKEKADTSRRGLHTLVRLADLNTALERLPMKLWEVVLLHGLLGMSQEDTGAALQVSQQAVSKRYRQGLEETTYWINGGE